MHPEIARRPRLRPLFVALFTTALGACATTSPQVRSSDWQPTERWLFMDGADSARMAVVDHGRPGGDAMLRLQSINAPLNDVELPRLIRRMHATVLDEKGVGIAAPQVGVSRRVILVQRFDRTPAKPFEAYVNATLISRSADKGLGWEGCLSVAEGFGQVRRSKQVQVGYEARCSVDGRCIWFDAPQTEEVDGFTAVIFQHEVDHINGKLFIDRREPGPLMPERAYRAMRAREKAAKAAKATKSAP